MDVALLLWEACARRRGDIDIDVVAVSTKIIKIIIIIFKQFLGNQRHCWNDVGLLFPRKTLLHWSHCWHRLVQSISFGSVYFEKFQERTRVTWNRWTKSQNSKEKFNQRKVNFNQYQYSLTNYIFRWSSGWNVHKHGMGRLWRRWGIERFFDQMGPTSGRFKHQPRRTALREINFRDVYGLF